jgi:replicative superfamily II helicase
MNNQFIELKKEYINKVIKDRNFKNKYAKSTAQNILSKINGQYVPEEDIAISPNHMFMSAFYLLYSIVDIIECDEENIDDYSKKLKLVASTFESISNISEINNKYNTIQKGEALTLSSIAYNIAGYHANSHYISSLALQEKELNEFYKALNLLMIKDFSVLNRLLNASEEPNIILTRGIFDNILRFIHFGEVDVLKAGKEQMERYIGYFFDNGDVNSWSALILLKPLLKRLEKNSLWNNIPIMEDIMWREYVESLSFQKTSVTELWPSQIEALDSGLLKNNENCIIKMPTSAGKTLIAEIAILNSLIRNENKKCIYIAPFKSLAVEVREKFEKTIGVLGYRINVMYGEYDIDGFEDEIIDENDILVLTPEKLDLIIRENEGFAEQISLIVIDEGHILGSGARGIRSEFLINRVRRLSKNVRVLFISAVFTDDDLDIMDKWLKRSIVANSNWKPTTVYQGIFNWRNNNKNEKNGVIQFLDLYGEKIESSFYTRVFSDKILNVPTNRMNKYPNSFQSISSSLAIYFQQIGQTIVFCARKKETEKISEEILLALGKYYPRSNLNNLINNDAELMQIINYLLSYFDDDSLMIRALKKGIAFHHSDLPDEVRQIIENAFNDGKIKILCCTTTLAQGVNLPANNIIIHSVNHYRDEQTEINLTVKDYWNICGRAGRAYKSTEGNIIFVPKSTLFTKYKNSENIETSISAFASVLMNANSYVDIMKGALSKRLDINKIYNGYEEKHDENVDSLYSQLVALLCEEIVDDENVVQLIDFLKGTLLYHEVNEDNELIEDVAITLFGYIQDVSKKYGKETLKRYYSTGLNIASCEMLEEQAVELMYLIINNGLEIDEILNKIIDISFSVSEINPSFEGISLKEHYELSDVIKKWINYSHIKDIKEYFVFKNDMQFYNFINKTFVQKAPWGIHSFIKILEDVFQMNNHNLNDYLPDYKYIASKAKYGVSDIPAIFVCSLGIQNRSIAKIIARYYIATGKSNEYKYFKKWFSELMVEDIMKIFDYSLDGYSIDKVINVRNKTKYNNQILKLRKAGVKTIICKVVGMFYEDRYKHMYNLENGDDLILYREVENRFDPFAVEVYNGKHDKIGYIEREYAKFISSYLDRNYKYKCIIKKLVLPNPPNSYGSIQVQIELIR